MRSADGSHDDDSSKVLLIHLVAFSVVMRKGMYLTLLM